MRCRACNCSLTDFESSRRYSASGADLGLCTACLGDVVGEIHTIENFALFDRAADEQPVFSSSNDSEIAGKGYGPDSDEPDDDFGRFDEDQV